MKSKKILVFIWMIVSILTIGIISSGYFYYNTTNDPSSYDPAPGESNADTESDLKTYKHDTQGFEFKYPANIPLWEYTADEIEDYYYFDRDALSSIELGDRESFVVTISSAQKEPPLKPGHLLATREYYAPKLNEWVYINYYNKYLSSGNFEQLRLECNITRVGLNKIPANFLERSNIPGDPPGGSKTYRIVTTSGVIITFHYDYFDDSNMDITFEEFEKILSSIQLNGNVGYVTPECYIPKL
jgi:hypothetical protein